MVQNISRVAYYCTTVEDRPGEAYRLLAHLKDFGISLLAFTVVPVGINRTQLTLFPDDGLKLKEAGGKAGLVLDGPHPALLVQGDDRLGALADVHSRLYDAGVNVYASSGVADGRGSYGYVVYVRPEEYEQAAATLEAWP